MEPLEVVRFWWHSTLTFDLDSLNWWQHTGFVSF